MRSVSLPDNWDEMSEEEQDQWISASLVYLFNGQQSSGGTDED